MKRPIELYIHQEEKNKFINELDEYYNYFLEKVVANFVDPNNEADNYLKELENNPELDVYDYDGYLDLSLIQAKVFRRYTTIKIMQYRTICLYITGLCEVWEQQLYSYSKKEFQKQYQNDIKGKNITIYQILLILIQN